MAAPTILLEVAVQQAFRPHKLRSAAFALWRTSARFVVRPLRMKPTSLGFHSVGVYLKYLSSKPWRAFPWRASSRKHRFIQCFFADSTKNSTKSKNAMREELPFFIKLLSMITCVIIILLKDAMLFGA